MIGTAHCQSSRLLSSHSSLLPKSSPSSSFRVVSFIRPPAKTTSRFRSRGDSENSGLISSFCGKRCRLLSRFRGLEPRRILRLRIHCSEKGRVLSSEGQGSRSTPLLESEKSGIAVNCGTAWCLILLQLWISSRGRVLEKGKTISHLMKHIGRVLAMAVVFVVLGLSPTKLLHRRALAAPPVVASTAPRDVRNSAISTVEEETDNYVKQVETKVLEAEAIEQKLADLEILEKETAEGIKSERQFTQKIKEAIGRKGRGNREAGAIRQAEEFVRGLQQEIAILEKEVAINIDDYLSIWKEVDATDVDSAQRGSKEETLKEAEDRLVISWRKIAVLEAGVQRIYDLWWEILTDKQGGGEQAKYAKELDRIAADIESQRKAEKEAKILPLATKVTTGEQPFESLIDEEDRETLAKVKQEQRKTKKLEALLNKLLENLYGPVDEEDPEYQKLLAEVKAILPPEMRATFGRGGDINAPVDDLQTALEWKNWPPEVEEEFKTFLSQNPEKRQEFIQEVQKEVLVARDRVLTQTWYDEKKKRWEMEPIAAFHAIDKKLAGRARIRHDRCVMYLTLKGDDREYYVDTRVFNAEYEDVGGFDTMYFKLLLSGVPTTIETMWIPFEEWEFERLFLLPFKIVYWLLEDLWNSSLVTSIRPWYFRTLNAVFEELMIRFGFPVVQNLLPHRLRVSLGFDLPEGAEAAEPTDIMIWQQEAQKHVEARYGEGSGSPAWWISLPVRTYIVGMPLLIVVKLALRVLLYPFKPLDLEMNEAEWKEKMQEKMEKELEPQMKKQTMDPIKSVFDKMKRVKRPEVLLKDFAGIDVIKEEISEVIRFLKDPKLFKEMGARPPRGVLIVGDSGTGKTTLALAIAAEARVPMIELQGAELEGGAWVGQGASNVRELFKTARELAPLIIFMDDFDHFAGVRGATSDTRKQDHESLINQLLVELDGFETQEGVVLVATTSRPYAIDEALRRPGRMDRTIELPLPNKREREQMLRQIALTSMDPHLVDYVDWGRVAEKTAGLTPAHLKHVPQGLEANAVSNKIVDDEELFSIFGWLTLVSKVAPRWFIDSKWYKKYNDNLLDWLGLRVTKEDISNAVESLDVYGETRPGIELYDPPYVWTREFKYPHAVWAVGKGLVTLLLPNYDVLDLIWLDPRSWEGIAFTKTSQRLEGGYEETGTMTRSYYEKELVSCFGSFVASRMLLPFGQNNTLSKFEMENAKEIATRMVMEYGWAPDDSPMIYQTDGSPTALSMGDEHEGEVAEKINRLYFTACEKAAEMLERNRPVMEAMVEHLLTWDAIGKQDFARIMEEKGAVLEQEPFSLVLYTHIEIVGAPTNGSGRSSTSLSVPSYT